MQSINSRINADLYNVQSVIDPPRVRPSIMFMFRRIRTFAEHFRILCEENNLRVFLFMLKRRDNAFKP
jgi:hypothetical protein